MMMGNFIFSIYLFYFFLLIQSYQQQIVIHIRRNLNPDKQPAFGAFFAHIDQIMELHAQAIVNSIMIEREMRQHQQIEEKKENDNKNDENLDFSLDKEDDDINNTYSNIQNNSNQVPQNNKENLLNNTIQNKNNKKENNNINYKVKNEKEEFRRKKKEKFLRKQKIFSKICKYILYSIILFTFYVILKKIFEFLDFIEKPKEEEEKENKEELKIKLEKEKIIKEKQVGNKIM